MTGGQPFDPREALDLVEAESGRGRQSLDAHLWVQLLAWGLAWSVGFAAVWANVRGQQPYLGPGPASGLVLAALLAAAGVVTTVVTRRATRGVGGRSERVGRTLGTGWALAFLGQFLLVAALARVGITPEAAGVAYSGGAMLMTGLMYLSTSAAWDDPLQTRLGGWLTVVAVAGAWLGPVLLPLVGATLGGGGLLVASWLARQRGLRG